MEFQKHAPPHAHILIILDTDDQASLKTGYPLNTANKLCTGSCRNYLRYLREGSIRVVKYHLKA